MSVGPGDPFRPAERQALLRRSIPLSAHVRGYGPAPARRDLLAGATVAALAIPAGMAYAQLAGVDPIVGLYALLLPAVAYALLGSSRQLSVGPEGSISALVGAAILPLAVAGTGASAELAAMLALMVAACFAIAWAARLGWAADYLSRPVLVGYIHGIAAILVIGQLGKLLGVDVDERDPMRQLVEALGDIPEANGETLAVSALALGVLLPLHFIAPRLPAALLVVVLAIVASNTFDLADHGVAMVGDIPSGLPDLAIPSPSMSDFAQLAPAALGIFLVAFAQAILTARSFAGRHGEHIDVRQEMLALAAANASAGVSGGMAVGASGSRTAVNDELGASSQVSGLVAAGVVVLVLLFLTGPIADLPTAVLGAVIVGAALSLVEPAAWRELAASDRVELAIAAVATAGVLLAGVLQGIAFAIGLSIVDVVRGSARPHDAVLGWVESLGRYADVSVHRDAVVTPGVVVYRLDDRLFFANARYFKGRAHEAVRGAPTRARWLVFDAEAVSQVDTAGLTALSDLADELRGQGVQLAVARMKSPIYRRLDDAGVTAKIGAEHFYGTVKTAVQAAQSDLDRTPPK